MEAETESGNAPNITLDENLSFRLPDHDGHPSASQVVGAYHTCRMQARPIPIRPTNVYGNTTASGHAQVFQGDTYHIYNSFSSYDGPSLQNPCGNTALQRHAVAAMLRILSSSAARNDPLWQNFEARLTEPDEAHRGPAFLEGYAVDAIDAEPCADSREDELAFEDVFDDATDPRPTPRTPQLDQGRRICIAREEQVVDGTRTPRPVLPRFNIEFRTPLPEIDADNGETGPELAFRHPNTLSAAIPQEDNLSVQRSGIQHLVNPQDIIEAGSWFRDLDPPIDTNYPANVNWPTSHFTWWFVHGTPWHPPGSSDDFSTKPTQVDHRRIRIGFVLAQFHSVLTLPYSVPCTDAPMMKSVLTHTWLWEPSMLSKSPDLCLGSLDHMSRTCELIADLDRTTLSAQPPAFGLT